jgi:hypothetical protein
MSRTAYTLTALAIIGVLFVSRLYFLSLKDKDARNGFVREISHERLKLIYSITLPHSDYYFAGLDVDVCYLGTVGTPGKLIEVRRQQQRTVTILNPITDKVRAGKIYIDSPYFYLADLLTYKIYRGNTSSWRIDHEIHEPRFFSEFIAIGARSLVLRSLNPGRSAYVLSKEIFPYDRTIEAAHLLQKQIDGLFCTDGMLTFDKDAYKLVYIYYYRNEFICADTSLNLIYRSNTIDTISQAKLKVATIESMGASVLAGPPSIVNRKTSSSHGRLYINSNLIADNENAESFRSSDVIDSYLTSNGQYAFSFYVPKIKGQRLRYFAVNGNLMYVLHGQRLSVFKVPGE